MPAKPRRFLHLLIALTTGIVATVAISSLVETNKDKSESTVGVALASLKNLRAEVSSVLFRTTNIAEASPHAQVEFWPPIDGQKYPDLVLEDSNGQMVRLSDYAGKVILMEMAAVPCDGCQAFSGGHKYGAFGGFKVQPGLDSIHAYVKQYAAIDLATTDDVVFVQLLLYGERLSSPTREEVQGWAAHFRMNNSEQQMVLRGDPSMINQITYHMIPGFHLIDQNFILQSNSCGQERNEKLYTELLPKLRKLSSQPKSAKTNTTKTQENPFLKGT